jgi:AcrR family transcriptional regulator
VTVLAAAFRLFVDRGYAGTTIAAVAKEAEVSPETIYLVFGGKRGLLEGVIDAAIAGGHDSPPGGEDWWETVAGLPDARARLAAMVEYSCAILARTRAVHVVIRGAADKEAFASELRDRLVAERLRNQTARIRRHLRGHLRKGLSYAEAGQRYCALASPELYQMLTVDFGWAPGRHQQWLTHLLEGELLGGRTP